MSNKLRGKQIVLNNIDNIFKNVETLENFEFIYSYEGKFIKGQFPNIITLEKVTASGAVTKKNIKFNDVEFGVRKTDLNSNYKNSFVWGYNNNINQIDADVSIISLGNLALNNNTDGNRIIVIGHETSTNSTNSTDVIVLGHKSLTQNNGNNLIVIGNNSVNGQNNKDSIFIGHNLGELHNMESKLLIGNNSNNILLEGDFYKKELKIKGKLNIGSIETDNSLVGSQLLIRDQNGELKIIENPNNNVANKLVFQDGLIYWEQDTDGDIQ